MNVRHSLNFPTIAGSGALTMTYSPETRLCTSLFNCKGVDSWEIECAGETGYRTCS